MQRNCIGNSGGAPGCGGAGGLSAPHGPRGPFPPRILLNRKCITGGHSRLAPIMATVARNPTAQISDRHGTMPKA